MLLFKLTHGYLAICDITHYIVISCLDIIPPTVKKAKVESKFKVVTLYVMACIKVKINKHVEK